jgi:hypothetical protein
MQTQMLLAFLVLFAGAICLFLKMRKPSITSSAFWLGLMRCQRGGIEYNLISKDAQARLREFSDDFALAYSLGDVEQWARELGLYHASRALRTTFPIPVSAAGYHEFKGDLKYRKLFEKSFDLYPKTWQDGVAELASIVEAPDFIGWADEPARIAAEGIRLPNTIIAGLLEANAVQDFDGKAFFADDHPVNVVDSSVGTFDNNITGAGTLLNSGNLAIAKKNFRLINGPNGKPLGLRMTHLGVPAALEETARDLLERDMLLETVGSSFAAMPNRHKGTVKLVVLDELTNASKWYPMALNKPGMYPWIVQDEGTPEEIRHDKTSALYQTQLKIGVAYILRGNGRLALPQAMQRWDGSA